MKLLFTAALFILATHLYSQDPQGAGIPQWGRSPNSSRQTGARESVVQGQVLKHDGSPASGVMVRVTGASGSQVTNTNSEGEFQFTGLPWGTYELEADSGVVSTHRTFVLNLESQEVTLQFDGTDAPAGGMSRNSISVRQLKVPDKARKNYEKAIEETRKQKFEKALDRLSQALADYSCYADALILKSVLDLSAGKGKLAVDDAQQAIHCDGANGRAYFVLGAALNAQGQPQDAIRTLNEGIRFEPDSWQPYYELGKSFLALHRTAEAVSQLRRAEALSHDSFPPLHAMLATALLQASDYQNARAQFLLFLKQAPDTPDAGKIKSLVAQIEAKLQSAAPESASSQGKR